jgi:hypothetical protein
VLFRSGWKLTDELQNNLPDGDDDEFGGDEFTDNESFWDIYSSLWSGVFQDYYHAPVEEETDSDEDEGLEEKGLEEEGDEEAAQYLTALTIPRLMGRSGHTPNQFSTTGAPLELVPFWEPVTYQIHFNDAIGDIDASVAPSGSTLAVTISDGGPTDLQKFSFNDGSKLANTGEQFQPYSATKPNAGDPAYDTAELEGDQILLRPRTLQSIQDMNYSVDGFHIASWNTCSAKQQESDRDAEGNRCVSLEANQDGVKFIDWAAHLSSPDDPSPSDLPAASAQSNSPLARANSAAPSSPRSSSPLARTNSAAPSPQSSSPAAHTNSAARVQDADETPARINWAAGTKPEPLSPLKVLNETDTLELYAVWAPNPELPPTGLQLGWLALLPLLLLGLLLVARKIG